MPARKAAKQASPPRSAPRRITRSRAASQGLEIPADFHTPPDVARRPRKPSKSSQEPPIVEMVTPEQQILDEQSHAEDEVESAPDAEEQEQRDSEEEVEDAHKIQEVVSISSDSASDEEDEADDRRTQPQSKTDLSSFISDLGVPENESTPVLQLEYASSPVAKVATLKPFRLPLPTRKTLSPTTKRRQAINSSPKLPQRQITTTTTTTTIALRRESISPPPPTKAPTSRKRRRSQSDEVVSAQSASASDSEDDGQARMITYTPRPLSGQELNRFKRVRRVLGNNAAEQRAYEISIQRMADWKREHALGSTNSNPLESAVDSQSSSASQTQPTNIIVDDDTASKTTRSAPTTPAHSRVGNLLNPLLSSATKVFGFFGSRSAAPKLISEARHQTLPVSPPNPVETAQYSPVSDQTSSKTPDHAQPLVKGNHQGVSTISTPSKRPLSTRRPLSQRNSARARRASRAISREESARKAPESEQHHEPEPTAPAPEESSKSRKIDHLPHAGSRTNKVRHDEDVDSFHPDEEQEQGQKRKLGVGRTYSVPDDLDSGKSDTTSPPASPPAQEPRVILSPKAPSGRIGMTYSVPDVSISDDSLEGVPTLAYQKKDAMDYTEQDMKDYMRIEHGFDPEGLAAEIPAMLKGEMPEMFMRARDGIRAMEAQAQLELDGRIKAATQRRMANLENYAQEYEEYLHGLKVECHQYEALRAAQANAAKLAQEVEDQSPPQPRAFDSSYNVFEAAHAHDAPTPKSNVTWTENKENHATSPGPNEPPKYASDGPSTSAAKSAMKQANDKTAAGTPQVPLDFASIEDARGLSGRQLESYESQLSGINKYHPKQPSRLREVSRLSSSPAGGVQSPGVLGQVTPSSAAVDAVSPMDTSMHTLSDIAISPATAAVVQESPLVTEQRQPAAAPSDASGPSMTAEIDYEEMIEEYDDGWARTLPGKKYVRDAVLEAMQKLGPSPFYGEYLIIDHSEGLPAAEIERRTANVMAGIST